MKTSIITFDNKPAGDITLEDGVFGLTPIRRDILARVIQWQLAKRRAGTHKTKGISDISGTTRKPYKQKGSGNARQGSLRSPQFRGGAVIFGPVVRDHGFKLNKKIRTLGLRMALSAKASTGDLIIVDSLPDLKKTKEAAAKLTALGLTNGLFVVHAGGNDDFKRAVANIPNIDVLPTIGANVYSIIRRKKLVLTKDAVAELTSRLA